MGSKRWMLENGLGDLLRREAKNFTRVVDLFCGAGSVSWFAAQELGKPVLAIDLQTYAAVMARAVIERTNPIDPNKLWNDWKPRITEALQLQPGWRKALALDTRRLNTATWSKRSRELCENSDASTGPVWKAYGGYYFSPTQALTLDAMLTSLSFDEPINSVCLATIICAASRCAASPGHTAQPFKSTRKAARYLREAWLRDPYNYARMALKSICKKYAKVKGEVKVDDAIDIAATLGPKDLVFVDPPYSGVHYSRFYHVLETVARGGCGQVEGAGRYPPANERPTSSFSRKTESKQALSALLERLASAKSTVIFTFPAGESSNGLSGSTVEKVASHGFRIEKKIIKSRFSTLGGNNLHRNAQKTSEEMILLMRPL